AGRIGTAIRGFGRACAYVNDRACRQRLKPARSIATLALLIVALSPLPAQARTLAEISASGILRVGLTGDYAPYALRGADGKITGADVTMAQALAAALGVSLDILPTTWKTMADDLKADRFDLAMGGVSVTPARAAIGDFSVTVTSDG